MSTLSRFDLSYCQLLLLLRVGGLRGTPGIRYPYRQRLQLPVGVLLDRYPDVLTGLDARRSAGPSRSRPQVARVRGHRDGLLSLGRLNGQAARIDRVDLAAQQAGVVLLKVLLELSEPLSRLSLRTRQLPRGAACRR